MRPTVRPPDLSRIGAGFSDGSMGSQAVFRAALEALSHPGRPVAVVHDADVPAPGHPTSAILLLALLDAGSRLWLSPTLAMGSAAAWLRFHTGCTLVDEPAQAHFAWAANPGELPPLDRFPQGSDGYPDHSATCLIDVPALVVPAAVGPAKANGLWVLSGPGIRGHARLQIGGLLPQSAARFADECAANHANFPRGVDLFLAAPRQIVGLPRTTRVHLEA